MKKIKKSSLKDVVKEGDVLKKRLDQLRKDCEAALNDATTPNRAEKLKGFYHDCTDLRNEMADLVKRLNSLTKASEPSLTLNFDNKKADELNRLQRFITQLEEMGKKLEPDETEEEYYKTVTEADISEGGTENDEQDGDEASEESLGDEEEIEGSYDDDDDEDQSGEEEMSEEGTGEDASNDDDEASTEWQVLHDFEAQQNGDLSVKKGEVVKLLSVREDGWWRCESSTGERGYVPKTFLQEFIRYHDVMQEDEAEEAESPSSARRRWGSIRKVVSETSATDVLSAFGALPAGFRGPTSSRVHAQPDQLHTHFNFLAVKLSPSCLHYNDLFYNPATGNVRQRTPRIQKILSLLTARNIPVLGPNFVILDRLARVSLFDGVKFLSNVSAVRAQSTDKEGRIWTFNAKPVTQVTLESSEFFFRIHSPPPNTGVLVELSMVYKKLNSDQTCEVCCGWSLLPLFNADGTRLLNKQYDVPVNGGTPFEKGVEVDPTIARRTSSSKLMTLISRNKQPVLSLRTTAASDEQREKLDSLPNILVGKLCTLQAISCYRYHLACSLIRDRENIQSTEPIFSPFLSHFPSVMEQPDLTDVLLDSWGEKIKLKAKAERRAIALLTQLLIDSFMEWIYPLMHIGLPTYKFGDQKVTEERRVAIDRVLQKCHEKSSSLAGMLAPDVAYEPFDVSETSYRIVNRFCVAPV